MLLAVKEKVQLSMGKGDEFQRMVRNEKMHVVTVYDVGGGAELDDVVSGGAVKTRPVSGGAVFNSAV